MDNKKAKAIIESILFAMGEPVELSSLCTVLEMERPPVRELIDEMIRDYEKDNRGITIIVLDDAYQLCTKPALYEYLTKIAKTPRRYELTDALLETLSIIAYKQPITRLEVEKIRGFNSDKAINRLVEFGLAEEVGRLDAPGRPLLFGTTTEFLRSFGVASIDELPVPGADLVNDFRAEAEEEISLAVEV